MRQILIALAAVAPFAASAQHEGHGEPPKQEPHRHQQQQPVPVQDAPPGLPAPTVLPKVDRRGWPSPVMDNMNYSLNLLERLEYLPSGGGGALAWDFLGWTGGDYRRIWYKSEGEQGLSDDEGEGDLQVYYGRLIRPFWDLLVGLRLEGHWGEETLGRVSFGAGLQGLAPYLFETEMFVFLSQSGQISVNGTFSRDVYMTQRLVVQPRFEMNASLNSDERFGVGAGLNDIELSLRLRYHLSREFAPYVGVSARWLAGHTAEHARAAGTETEQFRLVAGLRYWF